MGDFYQNGVINCLHNLNQRPLSDLEDELARFAAVRPMGLVLPSLFSELEGPALKHIVDEISRVKYLTEIVIGLDRADKDQFAYARTFFSKLPQRHRILWNDGPRLKALHKSLESLGLAPGEEGKGRNLWYCYGYVLASGRSRAIACHDCDILTYDNSLLTRLIYPVTNPNFNYYFCKGFYARIVGDTMSGRVSRLLFTPLIRALKKVCGHLEYLDFLDSFRYPLAGEFSMRSDVLWSIRIPSDWGLEIGLLSEINRNYSNHRVCQVDIADVYDHKHQPLSADDPSTGLSKMCIDIVKAIFRKLAINGQVLSIETLRTIKATYYRIALDFIETYYHDAVMNGLKVDRHIEEQAVELFAANIMDAGQHYLDNPMEAPFVPSWNRVVSAIPDFLKRLNEAVELDNAD